MGKLKIGDVIEISTEKGFAYAQYTHKHSIYGALIRVFKNIHIDQSDPIEKALESEIQFSVFFPVNAGIKSGAVKIVANRPIKDSLKNFPVFRAGAPGPSSGKVTVWWLWDGQNEERIGSLSSNSRFTLKPNKYEVSG